MLYLVRYSASLLAKVFLIFCITGRSLSAILVWWFFSLNNVGFTIDNETLCSCCSKSVAICQVNIVGTLKGFKISNNVSSILQSVEVSNRSSYSVLLNTASIATLCSTNLSIIMQVEFHLVSTSCKRVCCGRDSSSCRFLKFKRKTTP